MIDTVVAVLRSGGEYTPTHAIALLRRVRYWWPSPIREVLLTDMKTGMLGAEERPLSEDVLPGWWAKLELFRSAHDDLGTMLYFDLDTLILGSLTRLTNLSELTLLQDFMTPRNVQSGLMVLPVSARQEARAAWGENLEELPEHFRGDGEALNALWGQTAQRWQDVLPGAVVSYKVHVRNNPGQVPPKGASVLCFHGRPRPWATPLWTRYAV